MDYISIVPQDLDISTSARYLRLPHPRTGQPQLFLPHASSSGKASILEVIKVNCAKRRTWFTGQTKIDAGSILIHYEIDPLFLVIPVIFHLLYAHASSSAPPPFQPLADLISTASSSSHFSLAPPFSGSSTGGSGSPRGQAWNPDLGRLLEVKNIRRVLRLCCERKEVPHGPPSPPPDDDPDSASKLKGQVYYRPSLERTLNLLRAKVEYFAAEAECGKFDHLVRAMGREGLLSSAVGTEINQLARIKASIEQFSQWMPHDAQTALMAGYDFTPLSKHLASLAASAMAASGPAMNIPKVAKGEKRKAPAASRGVESLKRVNTSSMSKLTSFFKAKDGVRGK